MTFVVCCDGAGKSGANGDSKMSRIEVISDRAAARQNLRIEPLDSAVNAPVPEIAADLVRIAAYVYFADQMASRGGGLRCGSPPFRRRG